MSFVSHFKEEGGEENLMASSQAIINKQTKTG